jgi:hypothetical protein
MKKKRIVVTLVWIFAMVVLSLRPVYAADSAPEQKPPEPAEKPLEPGWLSLDGSVGLLDKAIADGKGRLQDALGINISGFLDSAYNWSSNHPHHPANISGRIFNKDYNKIEFNNFNLTLDKPEKDWGVGFHLSGMFGREAELLRESTLWGKALHKEPSAELFESYVTTTIPVGEGLQFKGGLFVTLLGAEIISQPGSYNNNISNSYDFFFAIPFRHLGGLFTYPVLKTLSVTGGLVTGWDDPHDNNHVPSFLGGVNFTPSDAFGLASSIIVGPEQRGNDGRQRVTWSNVATIKPMDALTLLLDYTLGAEAKAPTPTGNKRAYWHTLSGVASYDWTDRFNTALRGEAFLDLQAARTFGLAATNPIHNVALGEFTLTGSYKFTKMLLGRAEVRQDFANRSVYQKGSNRADANQTTLAMQLIYTY